MGEEGWRERKKRNRGGVRGTWDRKRWEKQKMKQRGECMRRGNVGKRRLIVK